MTIFTLFTINVILLSVIVIMNSIQLNKTLVRVKKAEERIDKLRAGRVEIK